jgi:hypothetical protein
MLIKERKAFITPNSRGICFKGAKRFVNNSKKERTKNVISS